MTRFNMNTDDSSTITHSNENMNDSYGTTHFNMNTDESSNMNMDESSDISDFVRCRDTSIRADRYILFSMTRMTVSFILHYH